MLSQQCERWGRRILKFLANVGCITRPCLKNWCMLCSFRRWKALPAHLCCSESLCCSGSFPLNNLPILHSVPVGQAGHCQGGTLSSLSAGAATTKKTFPVDLKLEEGSLFVCVANEKAGTTKEKTKKQIQRRRCSLDAWCPSMRAGFLWKFQFK